MPGRATGDGLLSNLTILVNIDVEDLEHAVDFYTRALPLTRGRTLGDRVVELDGADCHVYLLQNPQGTLPFAEAAAGRRYDRHWTPVHADFVVDDLDAAVERAQAAGASLESGPTAHEWGTIASLADPFGNGFCLIEFTAEGYDAAAM